MPRSDKEAVPDALLRVCVDEMDVSGRLHRFVDTRYLDLIERIRLTINNEMVVSHIDREMLWEIYVIASARFRFPKMPRDAHPYCVSYERDPTQSGSWIISDRLPHHADDWPVEGSA